MSIDTFSALALPGGYENGVAGSMSPASRFAPPIIRGPGDVVYTLGQHSSTTFGDPVNYSTFFKTDYTTGSVGSLVHVFSPGIRPGPVVAPDSGAASAGGADNLGRLWYGYDSFLLGHTPGSIELAPTDSDSGNILFTFPVPKNGGNSYTPNVSNSFVDNGINYIGGLAKALNSSAGEIFVNLILYDAASGAVLLNVSVPSPGQDWIDAISNVSPSFLLLSDGLGYCYATSFEKANAPNGSITGSWIYKFALDTGRFAVYSYGGIYSILMDYNNKHILGFTQGGSIQVIDCATMDVISTTPNLLSTTGNTNSVTAYQEVITYAQSTRDKGPIADPLHCSFLALASLSPLTLRRFHLPDLDIMEDVPYPPPPVDTTATTTYGNPLYISSLQALIWTDWTPDQWQFNYSPSVCGGTGARQPNTSLIT
jgi:hypothetical protein